MRLIEPNLKDIFIILIIMYMPWFLTVADAGF